MDWTTEAVKEAQIENPLHPSTPYSNYCHEDLESVQRSWHSPVLEGRADDVALQIPNEACSS
jgi:hypothetical protein